LADKNPEIQKRLTERERARKDKLYLATEILGYQFQPDVHTTLFNCFIPFDSSKPWREQSSQKDRLILWSRGHFKSTAVVVEVIQAILNFPDIRVLLMQGSLTVTQNLLHEIKSHFLGTAPDSRLREIFPEFCADKLGTANAFTTPARVQKRLQQATVTVASPKSITTGQHYELGCFDDLVHAQNYQSAKKIKRAKDDFYACVPLIDPGCYRIVTGTRYSFGDLYEELIRNNTNNQWIVSVKDCFSDDGKEVRFPQRTLPDGRIIGFTREQLLQIQREDPGMFASQYLNRPATTGTQLFTEEKMLAAVVSERDSPALSQAFLFVDLASSQAETADDSVILAGKTDHLANMYVVDGIGGQWNPTQLAMQIILMSLKHRPLRVMIEKTASSAYFVEYLKVLCRDKGIVLPLDFIPVSNTKDAKNIRISSLEGHIRSKRLRFFAGLECWDKMLQQFVEFPRGRNGHDDYADTVALMAQVFGGQHVPVTPLSQMRHPLLAAIERQSEQQTFITPKAEYVPDSMGDDFSG
jgi:predicted phage terminase large subunit-like protein